MKKTINENFDDFLEECSALGIHTPDGFCEKALEEIARIDAEIEKIQELRSRKDVMEFVLKEFKHSSVKKRGRKPRAPIVNFDVSDDFSSYIDVLKDICDQIVPDKKSSPRDLIEKTKFSAQDTAPFYIALKWLMSKGILIRDANRDIFAGPEWNNKETILSSQNINNN